MDEITRGSIARVGVDLAKHVIQVHAVDNAGWCGESCDQARSLSGLVHGATAARLRGGDGSLLVRAPLGGQLRALGLDAKLIAANFFTPYRMQGSSGKNDAADAAAICEAASRPTMRFVPIKTVEQQAALGVQHSPRNVFLVFRW